MVQTSLGQTYQWQDPCTFFQAIFDSILIHLSCLNKYYLQNHHYFRSNRWFKLLLDKHINDSILARSFRPFWLNYDPPILFNRWFELLYTSTACILNEWRSDQKSSAVYLGALHAKERIFVTQPFRSKNRPNFFRSKSVIHIAVKASKLLWIFESHSYFFQTQQTKCNIFEWTFKVCVIKFYKVSCP